MIGISRAHKNQMSNYTSWLQKRGFEYRILTKDDSMWGITMLLLTGGTDVGSDADRDKSEIEFLNKATSRKIPVLGICRGLQISNVYLGGTLFKDLPEEEIKHTSNKNLIAGEKTSDLESSFHEIIFDNNSSISVNSRHHQGIDILAESLVPCAYSPDSYKLVEMAKNDKFLLVQWHPEREEVYDLDAEKIVYEWIKSNYVKLSTKDKIISYMTAKNFSIVSYARIVETIDTTVSFSDIDKIASLDKSYFSIVSDKYKRKSLKLIR